MAIKNTSQNWQIGQMVKVGFMSLQVVSFIPTPGDHKPDMYELVSAKGVRYTFTPHYGLQKLV